MTMEEIIKALNLAPHPEGGYYRRTYTNAHSGGRGYASSIYFLVPEGDFTAWHRFDADELWFWHAGAPLTLEWRDDDNHVFSAVLGIDLPAEQNPQVLLPANKWQRAQSQGDWTLVSCVVSPGFIFETFEMQES